MSFWGGLASGVSGYYEGQDQANQRELRALALKEAKEQYAQNQKVQQNLGAGMQGLEQMQLQRPPQQGPQAPPPGQSSQPRPPPPGGPQGGPPQGQMPPPPGGGMPPAMQGPFNGPPPQMGAPGGAPPIKPYSAPQAPQSPPQQQPQGIPPPPQQQGQQPQQGYDLRTLMMTIKKNNPGLDAQTIFGVASKFEPMLNMEGKMQLAQAQNQVRLLQAEAAETRAGTGVRGETRRGETAAGTNAAGAEKIDLEKAQAEAARARAEKDRRLKSLAGGGSGAGGGYTDSELTFLAQQALAGDTSVFQNAGRGAQGNRNVIAIRKKMIELSGDQGGTGADAAAKNAEYGGVKSGQRALGTAAANIGMAKNEASQMADLVLDASAKVPRTESTDINKLLLAGEKRTGDPAVVAYGAALNSFINAYARAVNPKGAPTVQDKNHAREMLSDSMSKGQVQAAIAQLKKEMDAAAKAPGAVRNEMRSAVTGGGNSDDKAAIAWAKANPKDPRAKKILDLHPGA